MKVIKRDGRIKDFDFTRIEIAVKRSFNEVYPEGNNELFSYILESLKITFDYSDVRDEISVEEIQDLVVDTLYQVDDAVAIAYQNFRNERTKARNRDAELLKSVKSLVNRTNK